MIIEHVKVLYTRFLAPSPFPAVSLSFLAPLAHKVGFSAVFEVRVLWGVVTLGALCSRRTNGMLTLIISPSCPWDHLVSCLCLWEHKTHIFVCCSLFLGLKLHVRSEFTISDVPHTCWMLCCPFWAGSAPPQSLGLWESPSPGLKAEPGCGSSRCSVAGAQWGIFVCQQAQDPRVGHKPH